MPVPTKARDMRGILKQRYSLLGSDRLWKSLDEVSVLGYEDIQSGSIYGHTGCINAMSWSSDGELLYSSGDDQRLLVWKHDPRYELAEPLPLDAHENCINLRCVNAIRTGHTNNVFAAKQLAPGSSLVGTCARDCTVRVFDIERAGGTNMPNRGYGRNEAAGSEARLHLFKCHTREVKRIATEHSQSTFLTVAGDRTVRQHDLRIPHTCPRCPPPLVKTSHPLSALGSSPLTPWYFVVAGESKYGHLFDRRMVGRDLNDERGNPGVKGQDLVACVARFGRDAEREANDHNAHVTGARMARSNGDEVILSYSGDAVYRYSIYDTPSESTSRQSSILPNNNDLESQDTGSSPPASSESNAIESVPDEEPDEESDEDADGDTDEDSETTSEDEDDRGEESPLRGNHTHRNQPAILPRSEYRGAANVQTVKDVNFLGKSDEYVASGSDDGKWFLWKKTNGNLMGIWEGDGSVVNVIEGHPFLPIVAVSGIDETIKIFEPKAGTKRKSHMNDAEDIMRRNADANGHQMPFLGRAEMIATLRMLQTSGRLADLTEGVECPTQ
ncbi:WD repeat protein iqw1 [Schizosaccharomyces pombe 972h-] [Rhizoctonia solani]|uniref:WD repeat protein iqw1 [Schizosaccharomyces pombe 972h-] n=1 Tax=Rhizoctonia solani TaxID=456999 RepID=A0A0K6FS60_9AGAM|nr:WD repeat protein iqw1 [Schizosaccharomyces pombe 972h-] [Rhizoctonia solani]